MKNTTVITIGREYGSGGRIIGEKLAERLEIPYYDKKILERLAKESGICDEVINAYDEKPTNSLLYSLAMNPYGFVNSMNANQSLEVRVHLSQVNLVKKIAKEGSCVLIGRGADCILKDEPNVFRFFICADIEKRIERIMKLESVSAEKAKQLIAKADKNRAQFYNYYTNQKWGDAKNYDLCVNSSVLGMDGTVSVLQNFIEQKSKQIK